MASLGKELQLLIFVAVNATVLVACWRFASRFTNDTVQRSIDTLLLTYVIQYAAVMLPGVTGLLSPITMLATAVTLSVGLLFIPSPGTPGEGSGSSASTGEGQPLPIPIIVGLLGVSGFVLAYCWTQRYLPPMGTDALTYHFPAAMHWLQQGRLERFQTWFFNPANTFSPLAGSAWYAWLLGPIGNDALAVHGQAPMVVLLFLAAVSIGRSLGSSNLTAVLAAVAICLSRPIVNQLDKGKDDLFLVAFFAVAVAAMVSRSRDPLQPWRIGLALGLCLAIKYTALLSMPVLLLMVQRVKLRDAAIAAGCVLAIAGPWYLANWVQFGNPLFPTDFLFFKGLFSTARSEELRTLRGIAGVFATGPFAVPAAWGIVLLIGWGGAFLVQFFFPPERKRVLFTIGPVVGLGLFLVLAPYAEIRFILPTLLLLTMAIHWFPGRQNVGLAGIAALTAVVTCVEPVSLAAEFMVVGIVLAVVGGGFFLLQQRIKLSGDKVAVGVAMVALLLAGYAWVNWRAFVRDRHELAGRFWNERLMPGSVWTYVRDELPPGETLAYTGTHLVYPFMENRRVVHIPPLDDVVRIADLPRLGDRLSGSMINERMQYPSGQVEEFEGWYDRLRDSGARYFVSPVNTPKPEEMLVHSERGQKIMEPIYRDPASGMVIYRIIWPSPPASTAPAR